MGLGLPEVLVEHDGGDVTRYLHLPTGVATNDGTWTYSAADGLGSVRQRLDASGQVAAVNDYRPFGSPLAGDGGSPYGFTGEWWESDAGLLFLRARYYDPQLGIFLSPDPVPGKHLYLYVEANPINLVDPSGMCPPNDPRCTPPLPPTPGTSYPPLFTPTPGTPTPPTPTPRPSSRPSAPLAPLAPLPSPLPQTTPSGTPWPASLAASHPLPIVTPTPTPSSIQIIVSVPYMWLNVVDPCRVEELPEGSITDPVLRGLLYGNIYQGVSTQIASFSGVALPPGTHIQFGDLQYWLQGHMGSQTQFLILSQPGTNRYFAWDAHVPAPDARMEYPYWHFNQQGMANTFGIVNHTEIPPSLMKQARFMRVVHAGGKVLFIFAVTNDSLRFADAVLESVEAGNPKPAVAESVRIAGGWAGAWAGAKAGCATGGLLGIETGPGMLATCAIGGLFGGILGAVSADWIADKIYED